MSYKEAIEELVNDHESRTITVSFKTTSAVALALNEVNKETETTSTTIHNMLRLLLILLLEAKESQNDEEWDATLERIVQFDGKGGNN